MALALSHKEALNAHLYAAMRLIFITHKDQHYGNLRYCAKPLMALMDEPEAASVISLKLGEHVAQAAQELLAFHSTTLKELDNYMALYANLDNAPDFKPNTTDIASALPQVDAFLKQDIDPMLVSQITLQLNQQFAMAGMLHSKPQF